MVSFVTGEVSHVFATKNVVKTPGVKIQTQLALSLSLSFLSIQTSNIDLDYYINESELEQRQ
jgi:hypothetical protein